MTKSLNVNIHVYSDNLSDLKEATCASECHVVSVHSEDISGVKEANIQMSTIQAVVFRRNQLRQVGKTNKISSKIKRPGVYILIGFNKENQRCAYIGQSESVYDRLCTHDYDIRRNSGSASKIFWDDTVVFSCTDENLTKSHILYVEAHLIHAAEDCNDHWSATNSHKNPSDDAGKLPQSARYIMDAFIDQAKILVEVFGWDLFREMQAPIQSVPKESFSHTQDANFFYTGKGFGAEMYIGPSGRDFIVRAESKAKAQTVDSTPESVHIQRKELIDKGVLREEGEFLIFTKDHACKSPSGAARLVSANNINGRLCWKLENGFSYAEWEVALRNEEEQTG